MHMHYWVVFSDLCCCNKLIKFCASCSSSSDRRSADTQVFRLDNTQSGKATWVNVSERGKIHVYVERQSVIAASHCEFLIRVRPIFALFTYTPGASSRPVLLRRMVQANLSQPVPLAAPARAR